MVTTSEIISYPIPALVVARLPCELGCQLHQYPEAIRDDSCISVVLEVACVVNLSILGSPWRVATQLQLFGALEDSLIIRIRDVHPHSSFLSLL